MKCIQQFSYRWKILGIICFALLHCSSVYLVTGDIDFVTTTINVTFTPGNPLVAVNIVILDDTVLEIDEVFVTHLIVTNDTLDGRVTAGNITDVVVTILDDEGM